MITAVATDDHGNQTTSPGAAITVSDVPIVTVDAGLDGSTVGDDTVLVTGTVMSDGNTGVNVNGIPAMVDDAGHWAANYVPLPPGANTLTVTATTVDGATSATSVSVVRDGISPLMLLLRIEPPEGITDHTANISVENRGGISIQKLELDAGGGVLQDITSLPSDFSLNYSDAGTYYIKVIATTPEFVTYQVKAAVVVHSGQALYAKARTVLQSMLSFLQINDVDHAVHRLAPDVVTEYKALFDGLAQANTLASSVLQFGEVDQAGMTRGMIDLLVVRDTSDGPQGFWIHLNQGDDGVWRIESM